MYLGELAAAMDSISPIAEVSCYRLCIPCAGHSTRVAFRNQATLPWINDTEITRRVSFRLQVRHICAQQLFSASGPEVVLIGIREVHVQDYLAWMTSKALKV